MRLIFAGTPAFASVALDALVECGHVVALVLTQPDRPAGRGMANQQSDVKGLAQRYGLPVYQPASLRQAEATARLQEVDARAMIVAAYGLILPQAVLDLFPFGCINIHASLLPRWRGAAPIQRAIEAGDQQTGISIMRMEAGLDTGPVYLRRTLPIEANDTARTLHDRLAVLGGRSICAVLSMLAEGSVTPTPQAEEDVTYARKISKSEAPLDWSRSAQELERQVRAFDPFPVAITTIGQETLRIWRASATQAPRAHPGVVTRVNDEGIVVQCGGGGELCLESLQRSGGKRMSAAQFLRGMPVQVGEQLGRPA